MGGDVSTVGAFFPPPGALFPREVVEQVLFCVGGEAAVRTLVSTISIRFLCAGMNQIEHLYLEAGLFAQGQLAHGQFTNFFFLT